MNENEQIINWDEIFNIYNTIKWLYALCEETDEELYTNIQPFNEFRAALDHLMRIVAIEHIEVYEEKNKKDEAKKLKGHLERAFFDICDMLSMNYRNKIIDILEKYTVDEINNALPSYFSEIKPRISELSEEIANLRTLRRFNENNELEDSVIRYSKIIEELQTYYKTILRTIPSFLEIRKKNKKNKRTDIVCKFVIPIISIVVAITAIVVGKLV